MRLTRFAMVLLLGTATAAAQVPRHPQPVVPVNLPSILVANPYSFTPQDSVISVQVGDGMRLRMEKVAGEDFTIVTRQQMNEGLVSWGFSADAMLPLQVQRSFATAVQGKLLLGSTMIRDKDQNGAISITARLAGVNDDAGNTVVLTQKSGQGPAGLGASVADAFQPAAKSWSSAKACMDQRQNNADKAAASAKKALQVMPTNGLAHYCLALLSFDKKTKNDSAEARSHLQQAAAADQLSLPVWTALAAQYELLGDTVKTVDALKQMLRISPTNQPLREQAFKIFLKYQRPDAAEQTALDGLKIDPTNADLWDLLSNARVYKGDFKGAVDALEQVVASDTARADSAFYMKITVMASQQPDTVRLLKWAQAGVKKYPNHLELTKQLLAAYNLKGPVDSSVAVTRRLMQMDTGTVAPALAAAQALQTAKRINEAKPFLDFVVQHGDAQVKEGAATILLNGALPLLQPPQNFDSAAVLLRQVAAWADSKGKIAPIANYYLGLSLLQQIPKIDPEAEKTKSCDLATKEQGLAADAEAAFKAAVNYTAKADDLAKFQKYLDGLRPRIASMLKAYCR